MKKIMSATLACVMLATSVVSTGAMAQPRLNQRDRYVQSYCANHPRDRDCRDWRRDRSRWDDNHYRRWYRDHRRAFGADDAAAAIFGFALGVMGTAAAHSAHVARCEAHYRSYDRATDTFLGYDGQRHRCRL
jgi:hypothetical protein